jgi:hypothetical protein
MWCRIRFVPVAWRRTLCAAQSHTEFVAASGEFADEIRQRLVIGIAADSSSQHGNNVGGGAVPVDEELSRFGVQEGVPGDIGWLHRLLVNLGVQRGAELVGCHDVATLVAGVGGSVGDRIKDLLDHGLDSLPRRRSAPSGSAGVVDPGQDVYRIEAADPYPTHYDATVECNKREQDQDARPAIAGAIPAMTGYDTVLLGSPIWNVRPPMVMRTFIDAVDLRGKTILPFVTYAVSGMGDTIDEYTRACPDSRIGEGLAVRGEEAREARNAVDGWLTRTGLLAI